MRFLVFNILLIFVLFISIKTHDRYDDISYSQNICDELSNGFQKFVYGFINDSFALKTCIINPNDKSLIQNKNYSMTNNDFTNSYKETILNSGFSILINYAIIYLERNKIHFDNPSIILTLIDNMSFDNRYYSSAFLLLYERKIPEDNILFYSSNADDIKENKINIDFVNRFINLIENTQNETCYYQDILLSVPNNYFILACCNEEKKIILFKDIEKPINFAASNTIAKNIYDLNDDLVRFIQEQRCK